jgi:U3 small nucleolar ribonucleoprotein protein IMP4
MTLATLTDFWLQHRIAELGIVNRTHEQPDCLIISRLPYGPTAYLSIQRVVMRRKVENPAPVSSTFADLVFEDLTSQLGNRISTILKALFPVPKPESHRLISFINKND